MYVPERSLKSNKNSLDINNLSSVNIPISAKRTRNRCTQIHSLWLPEAQSTAMPRIPLRPIPVVTTLANPEPSGFTRPTPFCDATVLLKSHQ